METSQPTAITLELPITKCQPVIFAKKRAEPDHNMPPKTSEKKNKQEEEICIICDSTILEGNEDEDQIGDV